MLSVEQSEILLRGETNPPVANRHAGKIAVTIEKPERTSALSKVFGRSNFFLIYNSKDNSAEILRNPFAFELGGAGIQSARFLIENNIDGVIVKKIGMNPFRFLTSANIKVYQCKEVTAAEAIQLFTEGKLISLEYINGNFSPGRKRKRCGRNFLNKKYINNKKGKI